MAWTSLALDAIVTSLGKKATFEKGVRDLIKLVEEAGAVQETIDAASRSQILSAVSRVATLLKTRYTAPGFWAAGLRLFQATEPLASGDAGALGRLREHRASAEDFLGKPGDDVGEAPQQATQRPSRVPYQFQGQLSLAEAPPRPAAAAEAMLLQAMMQAATAMGASAERPSLEELLLGEEADARRDMEGTEQEEQGAVEAEERESGEGNPDYEGAPGVRTTGGGEVGPTMAAVLEEMLQSLGADAIPGLEEAIEASMQQGAQQAGAPPASKKEVEKLPTFQVEVEVPEPTSAPKGPLDAPMGEERGKETFCTVCQEAWKKGDMVRQMPCSHKFHVECLQPWLDQRNSCPVCRHEMPTDDMEYEVRKEKEMRDEEERRGAENAVREGVYMYL